MRRVKCELSEKEKAVSFDLGQISLKAIFKYLIILVDLPLPSNGKKMASYSLVTSSYIFLIVYEVH